MTISYRTSPHGEINLAAGSHLLTAKATDDSGAVTTAAAVTVTASSLVITVEPADQTVVPGGSCQFSVVPTGPRTVSYRGQETGLDLFSTTPPHPTPNPKPPKFRNPLLHNNL